jgi:hypothetical protein
VAETAAHQPRRERHRKRCDCKEPERGEPWREDREDEQADVEAQARLGQRDDGAQIRPGDALGAEACSVGDVSPHRGDDDGDDEQRRSVEENGHALGAGARDRLRHELRGKRQERDHEQQDEVSAYRIRLRIAWWTSQTPPMVRKLVR